MEIIIDFSYIVDGDIFLDHSSKVVFQSVDAHSVIRCLEHQSIIIGIDIAVKSRANIDLNRLLITERQHPLEQRLYRFPFLLLLCPKKIPSEEGKSHKNLHIIPWRKVLEAIRTGTVRYSRNGLRKEQSFRKGIDKGR